MTELALASATTLTQNEAIIERGIGSFREVGMALMRIRDEEQYREAGFNGFVEYLESKPWGFSRDLAYKTIDAAHVSTIVEIPNEAQARELAPLAKQSAPEVVREVYAEATEEAGGVENVTAKLLREKVKEILPPRIIEGKTTQASSDNRAIRKWERDWTPRRLLGAASDRKYTLGILKAKGISELLVHAYDKGLKNGNKLNQPDPEELEMAVS